MKFFQSFLSDDHGAVTVDFVVLTAAICLLGFVVVSAFSGGATDLANEVQVTLNDVDV